MARILSDRQTWSLAMGEDWVALGAGELTELVLAEVIGCLSRDFRAGVEDWTGSGLSWGC